MAKKSWEEVSIVVEQGLADTVVDLLSGILPGGIVQERIFGGIFPEDLNQEIGPVRVFGYLPIDDQIEEQRKEIIKTLGSISRSIEPSFLVIEEQNWTTAWQKHYQPIRLGSGLVVVPSWLKNPTPDRTPIYIDPEMAFGSGTHPTTQMSLILLEKSIFETPVNRMIDIGCGSGILSIAAAKLGVREILGVDIDPDAVRLSKANAIKNRVEKNTYFHLGSIGDLKKERTPFYRAPLVAANIIAPILTSLFKQGLCKILLPGGSLVLSGILEEQLPDMLIMLNRHGVIPQTQLQQDEWIALIGIRSNEYR